MGLFIIWAILLVFILGIYSLFRPKFLNQLLPIQVTINRFFILLGLVLLLGFGVFSLDRIVKSQKDDTTKKTTKTQDKSALNLEDIEDDIEDVDLKKTDDIPLTSRSAMTPQPQAQNGAIIPNKPTTPPVTESTNTNTTPTTETDTTTTQ